MEITREEFLAANWNWKTEIKVTNELFDGEVFVVKKVDFWLEAVTVHTNDSEVKCDRKDVEIVKE